MTDNENSERADLKPVVVLKPTVSSFYYDEDKHELVEYEFYFRIARKAGSLSEIVRMRAALEEKTRRHFQSWLSRHLDVHLNHKIHVNFEREERSEKQAEEDYASVRRLRMRRVGTQWFPDELPSGRMRFEGGQEEDEEA